MKVLASESRDKKIQNILEIPYEDVLKGIEADQNWHEVVAAYDPKVLVRAYFDIDCAQKEDPLKPALGALNAVFGCSDADWAVSCGSREGKFSYHILSTKYCLPLQDLRRLTFKLNAEHAWFDVSAICISMTATHENLFLRFPNQSKDSINKPAPPMKILQGDLKDFFVTQVLGLQKFQGQI
jgi:hypothetical protein